MRLYLVRHPQPLVAPGTCYGSTDLAVAAQERERILPALLANLPGGVTVFSSPLRRCAELAADLAGQLGSAPVRLDARLAEMHFGDWERRLWSEISRAEIDAWAADLVNYQPGGGECVLQMAQRVCAFYTGLLSLQQDAIVICHAGTIRLLAACRPDSTPADIALQAAKASHKIGYGELMLL